MALTKCLLVQPAAGGNAETVRHALPAAVQEPATHQESPRLRPQVRRTGSIDDERAEAVDQPAMRRHSPAKDGPDERVDRQLSRQSLDEGLREEEIV